MSSKRVTAVFTVHVAAGEASPAKVGKDIGPHGINIMEFCRAYNAATATQHGYVVPARITVFEDRSFTFVTKTPTTATLLARTAGIDKGSAWTNGEPIGWVTREQLREIARIKLVDLNTSDLEAAQRTVAGTARSMGIAVRD